MGKHHNPYAPEFRAQMVELVKAGRSPEELAREFEPTEQTIYNWVAQSDRDSGKRHDGLTTAEREELTRLRRENRQLRLEREILSKAAAWFARETGTVPEKGSANQATLPIATMARLLRISASGYYAWLARSPSKRSCSDADLLGRIRAIHASSRGTYGMLRIHAELLEHGVHAGRKRIARLMRIAGLCGVSRRRWINTTRRQSGARPAPDLVQRHFVADAPNRLWVADATYVPTAEGFLYLAVVLDVFSRRIVGWAMSNHLYSELMLRALDMALVQRRPKGVIHHSDQGSKYTSLAFGRRCREAGVRPSMGTVGDCFDNAMCESFFATLECELLARSRFESHEQARRELFAFIEGWYNLGRRHSAIGYHAPIRYETMHQQKMLAAGELPPPAGVVVVIGDPPTGRGQLAQAPNLEEICRHKIQQPNRPRKRVTPTCGLRRSTVQPVSGHLLLSPRQ